MAKARTGRMSRGMRLWGWLCLLVLAGSRGGIASPLLHLSDILTEARQANIDIRVSKEKLKEAEAMRKERFAAFFPKISLNSYGSHAAEKAAVTIEKGAFGNFFSLPFPSSDVEIEEGKKDNVQVGVKLEQPVFTGGKYYYPFQVAKAEEKVRESGDQWTIAETLLEVEKTYFDVLKSKDRKRFAEKHQATLESHASDVEVMFRHGRITRNDVLKAKVDLARAKKIVRTIDHDLRLAQMNLNVMLDRPLEEELNLAPVGPLSPISFSREEAVRKSLAHHPLLERGRSMEDKARWNRKISEAGYWPDIIFTAEYFKRTDQPVYPEDNWYVMMNLDWPIWEWGRTSQKVSATRSVERQNTLALSELEKKITVEVSEKWLYILEVDAQMEVAEETLSFARENLRVTQMEFASGTGTSTEVLEAEELLLKSESDLVDAKYNAHYARAMLYHAMGMLDGRPEDGKDNVNDSRS